MNRDRLAGHALRRLGMEPEKPHRYLWACECGQEFGYLSVHPARAAWREHKAAVAQPETVGQA